MGTIAPSKEDLLRTAVDCYRNVFDGELPSHAGCGPGRVNLIGEHTDYNAGFVFPMALPNVTLLVGARNNSEEITIYSGTVTNEQNRVTFPIPSKERPARGQPGWANYVKGVIALFSDEYDVPGFNAVVVTSVPMGAGVSSSAAIEVATFTFLEALALDCRITVDKKDKALICQKAEHIYAEMPCGIMDQYISIFGKEGHALLLDCQNLTHQQIPFGDPDVCILITNSNMKHKLDGSEYPLRASQCKAAARIMGLETLRQATTKDLDKYRTKMSDGEFRRARHVVTEIARCTSAAAALRLKDYSTFGALMLQSHVSLKEDFEVSTPELDELVEIAVRCKGVYGSRLTGAGFGGSTVTLVKTEQVNELIEALKQSSLKKLDFHIARASDGAQNLTALLHQVLQASALGNKRSTMTQTKSLVK